MIRSFYTAVSGVMSQEQGMAVSANNVANSATNGFKPDKSTFSDLVTTSVYARQNGTPDLRVGQGTKLAKTDTLFSEGGLSQTNQPQDYALTEPNQFFAVRSANGTVQYTRDGSFQLSRRADGKFYLANASAELVLDSQGQPIAVSDGQQKQNVGVYTFPNPDGLLKMGDNNFQPTALSGTAVSAPNLTAKQGWLEESTVNMTDELSDLLLQSRTFNMDSKMVQISDEIVQTVNDLR